MRHRQRGVTFIGWLVLLLPSAIVIYAGIRLTPLYLEYMSVARTLEQVKTEFDGNSPTASAIFTSIGKHFELEDNATVTMKDITIKPQGRVIEVSATYDATAPLFADIALVVSFDKKVEISQ